MNRILNHIKSNSGSILKSGLVAGASSFLAMSVIQMVNATPVHTRLSQFCQRFGHGQTNIAVETESLINAQCGDSKYVNYDKRDGKSFAVGMYEFDYAMWGDMSYSVYLACPLKNIPTGITHWFKEEPALDEPAIDVYYTPEYKSQRDAYYADQYQ